MKPRTPPYLSRPPISLGQLVRWSKAILPGAFTTSPTERDTQAHNKAVDTSKAAKRPWKTMQ